MREASILLGLAKCFELLVRASGNLSLKVQRRGLLNGYFKTPLNRISLLEQTRVCHT